MPNTTSALTKIWTVDMDAKRVAATMVLALFFGAAVVVFGTSAWAGLLWAGACSAVGWFLGFLFGIPRSLSSDTARTTLPVPPRSPQDTAQTAAANAAASKAAPDKAAADPAAADVADQAAADRVATDAADHAAANHAATGRTAAGQVEVDQGPATQEKSRGPSTAVNTNLEQISDWLTKIIVGVTLVEINPAIDRMGKAAELIAGSLGGDKAVSVSLAYGILVYFSITGFLGSYLLTRLFLQRAFSKVDSGDRGDQ